MAEETEQKPAKPAPAAPAAPPAKTKEEVLADPIVAAVASAMPAAFVNAKDAIGEISLYVARESIVDVCRAFKADSFTYLVDLCGSDYSTFPGHAGERFCVNYLLYSFEKNVRIRLKVFVADDVSVPSVTSVWKTANWHERETFDMFGIRFEGHPNLERILMWEGFNGHPLRKDFPIRGIDTGARIYPEVFPPGGGPAAGSTGKSHEDVNIWKGPAVPYGRSPKGQVPETKQVEAPQGSSDEGKADA
ncbi:MAG: NADH-quinone oxidoreductase subunit C [Thermoanaerobaculia bacterium]|nr:NADH-quinone oxidoreductase subunit C [Thermoanaerobaculia bacterium]